MYQPVSQRKRGRTRGLSRFQTPGPVTGAMNRGLTAMAAKMTSREKRKTRKTKRNSRVPIVVPFKANTGQAVWGSSPYHPRRPREGTYKGADHYPSVSKAGSGTASSIRNHTEHALARCRSTAISFRQQMKLFGIGAPGGSGNALVLDCES